jgi:hypothetical protein
LTPIFFSRDELKKGWRPILFEEAAVASAPELVTKDLEQPR